MFATCFTVDPSPLTPRGGQRRGSTWSRRSFLGTLTAVSVGVASGCGTGGTDLQDFGSGSGLGRSHGAGVGGGAASLTYQPVAPYTLNATSVLSEDYFPVAYHKIDVEKDTVIAYSRAGDGQVEAIVLQGGTVSQLYRDSTQAGGWNLHPLPGAASVQSVAAGMSVPFGGPANAPAVLKVFYTKVGDSRLTVAVEQTRTVGQAPTFTTTDVAWDPSAAALQIAQNADQSVLVTGMVNSTAPGKNDAHLLFYTDGPRWTGGTPHGPKPGPVTGSLTGFVYYPDSDTETFLSRNGQHITWAAVVARTRGFDPSSSVGMLMLYIPGAACGGAGLQVWLHPMVDQLSQTPLTSYGLTVTAPTSGSTVVAIESVQLLGVTGSSGDPWEPTIVVRAIDASEGGVQSLWTATTGGINVGKSTGNVTWNGLLHDADSADRSSSSLRPRPSGAAAAAASYLDLFIVADNTLTVMRQYAPDPGAHDDDQFHPLYTAMMPLQPGVAAVISRGGSSVGDGLFLVGTDGTLQTLVRDSDSLGWTDTTVQLPAGVNDQLQQVSAYRTVFTLVDAWNTPIADTDLQVSASSAVTVLVDGGTVALSDDAVTRRTDDQGQLTLVSVADGLSAPTLYVTGPKATKASIDPSAPINTYMLGGTNLNYIPPLTASSLADAKTIDNDPVVPSGSTADVAEAVSTMNQAAAAVPKAPAAKFGKSRSSLVGRPDGTVDANLLHGSSRHRHGRPGKTESTSHRRYGEAVVGASVDHWLHDALHGIKKAAVAVDKIVISATREVTIGLKDLEGFAGPLKFIIEGVEDAAHVFHSALNKIDATVVHAVKWLVAEVLDTLKAAVQLAGRYDGWVKQCCDLLTSETKVDAVKLKAWLLAKEDHLKTELTNLANSYKAGTTLSTMAANPPSGSRTSRARPPRIQQQPHRVGDNTPSGTSDPSPHGDWWLNKVKNELFGALELHDLATPIGDLMEGVLRAVAKALEDFWDAFKHFADFLGGAIKHPDDVKTLGVRQLLLAVVDLLSAVFELLNAAVDVLLNLVTTVAGALWDTLSTNLIGNAGLPFKLLALADPKLGKVSLGTVVSVIYAFPAVVAYRVTHHGKGAPFADASQLGSRARRVRPREELGGDEATDLALCATEALLVWAFLDTLSDAKTASKAPTGPLFTIVDVASPLIVGCLTTPATAGGQPFLSPPVSGSDADTLNFISWLLGMLPAALVLAGPYLDKTASKDPDLPNQKSMLLIGTCLCGVFSLLTGVQANSDTSSPSGTVYAADVLNNIANIIAPLLDDRIVKNTEYVSAGVAAALTAGCGTIGAYLYDASAS